MKFHKEHFNNLESPHDVVDFMCKKLHRMTEAEFESFLTFISKMPEESLRVINKKILKTLNSNTLKEKFSSFKSDESDLALVSIAITFLWLNVEYLKYKHGLTLIDSNDLLKIKEYEESFNARLVFIAFFGAFSTFFSYLFSYLIYLLDEKWNERQKEVFSERLEKVKKVLDGKLH